MRYDRPPDARPAPKSSGGAPNPRELTAARVHAGCIWTFEKCKVDPTRLDPCDVKKKKCNKRDACLWVGKACVHKGEGALVAQLEDMQSQLQDMSGVKDEAVEALLQQTIDAVQDGLETVPDDEEDDAPAEPLPKGAFASPAGTLAAPGLGTAAARRPPRIISREDAESPFIIRGDGC